MAGNAGKDLSTSGRIQPEALLNLPNPLTPQVIQIEQHHSCAANGSQSFHFMGVESEVFRPPLLEGMKPWTRPLRSRNGMFDVKSGALQTFMHEAVLALPMCAQPDGPRQRLWHGHLRPLA